MTTLRPSRQTRRIISLLRSFALAFLIWSIIEAHAIYYRITRSERESLAQAVLVEPQRVFIASLHWNNEKILRSEWNKGVVELVRRFGPENVFVSVYESGSWDGTKAALRELDRALDETGVGRKIVLEKETHKDLIDGKPQDAGWITIPDGRRLPRRIPYLSRLRNLSLQPLLELAENGTTFDLVLFLGDVVFDVCPFAVTPLLSTAANTHHRSRTSSRSSKPTTATTPPHALWTTASHPSSTTRSPCATPAATSTPHKPGPTSAPPNPEKQCSTLSQCPYPAAGTA